MKFSKIFLITTLGLIGFTGESNSFEEEPARNTASISDYERLDNPMY